jgi:hypothetical protein
MELKLLVRQGLLIIESMRSHSDTHTHNYGKTPLVAWSARCKDLYLTAHWTHNRQISMSTVRFKAAILESQRPQTHVSDRAAQWIGRKILQWERVLPECSGFPPLLLTFRIHSSMTDILAVLFYRQTQKMKGNYFYWPCNYLATCLQGQ